MVRLAIVASALALLMLVAPAAFAGSHTEVTYAENGTDPVATFNATDEDGDAINWGVSGEDEDDFKIADGVLTFMDPPNFEKPTDMRADNVYKVTVTASGGSAEVEVTVTDVDEPGAPELDRPQPQVGRGLEATGPGDPDEPVTDVTWQWARSMDMTTWEDIGNPAGSGSRNPTTADIGYYLRATAMYTDKHGSGKTASVVSENPVEARTTSNAQPSFDDHDDSDDTTEGIQIARSVDENAKGAAVGKPISAKDDDTVLLYTLTDADTTDTVDPTESFGIDSRTGQITTKVALDSNDGATNDADDAEDTYTVTVTAEDPSTAKASVTVVITVNNINDAPAFATTAPEELWVTENGTDLRTGAATDATALGATAYAATDDDTADTTLTYAVGGADKGSFSLSATGELTFMDHTPDYETKKSYSITLMVEDDEFALGTHDVTVTVTNAEDLGTVSLNAREPQAGKAVIATLTDKDGTVRGQSWQWARIAQTGDTDPCPATDAGYTAIDDATSPSYTPETGDADFCLRATVTYTDAIVDDSGDNTEPDTAAVVTDRAVQLSDPANTAPKFPDDNDPNTPGDQEMAEREVAENMETTVGDAVVAADGDLLMYSVDDTANFSVNNDGQISTKVELDYETQSEYTVTLMATDPSGAYDTIMVKITVTDQNDPAVITGTKTFEYAENGTDAVATFTAMDQDGDDIVWDLAGADAAAFDIAGGVLTFEDSPNFESATDERADNIYKVTVTATGGELAVEVTVTDVDEPGKPTLTKPQPQVGRGLEAEGPNDPDLPVTDVLWQWARSTDMTTWEDIGDPASSGSRNPTTADTGYYLRATAMYTDKHGSGKTASVVSENAVEARTLANARPSFADHDDANDTEDGIQIARTVDENAKGAAVGKPISAKDDDDVLEYSLAGDDDAAIDETTLFDIDSRSGQITTKVALDANAAADTDANEVTHTVVVTVVDPSGADASVDVEILVNNVNDAPAFDADNDPKTLWVNENTQVLRTVDAVDGTELVADTYGATDDDETDGAGGVALDLFVGGADKGSFDLSDSGTLTFMTDHTPDYETKKSYSITLMVEDNEFALGTLDVTVNVRNAEDAGSVSLNAREPQVGRPVLGTLDDKDGTIRGQSWQWYKGSAAPTSDGELTGASACVDDAAIGATCSIGGATSPAYTPGDDDVGGFLTARVTYTDAFVTDIDGTAGDDGDNAFKASERAVQISDPANTAPKFADDQDPNTPGDQPVAEREVPENMKTTVGDAVVATDADLLMYSVDDTTNFSVDNDGQISTKVELDFETQSEYMVMLTATDPSGASDSIMVKITVTDGPDDAVITQVVGPAPEDPGDTCGMTDAGSSKAADCRTLLSIMDDLVGDGTASLNWDEDTAITEWDGLAAGTDRVRGIYLPNSGLAGTLPAGIAALDALERLTLTDNDLTGDIPDLSGLDNLEILVLGGNAFTGGIPASLGNLDSLLRLWLHRNEGGFEGGIPAELGNLSNLRYLMLYGNGLTGSIPAELGMATNLKALYLHNNMLTGSIPAELGDLTGSRPDDTIRLLYLHNNMLSGDIPAELGNLTSLTRILLRGNMLTGCVPAAIADAADLDRSGLMACADDGS